MFQRTTTSRWLILLATSGLVSLLAGSPATADNYVSQGPFVLPEAGLGIPTPAQVSGKEYSDHTDKDDANPPSADALRVLRWDGVGGTLNGFDYSGTFLSGVDGEPIDDPGREVDALAGPFDALFTEVNNNQSALLLSSQGDPTAPILVESVGGSISTWATIAQVDAPGNDAGVVDLDGLEVWGGEGVDDAVHFSLEGDPIGVSVWKFDSSSSTSVPLFTTGQIAGAIGNTGLVELIDLDALMVGVEGILFSIRPIPNAQLDGGEIWFWDLVNPATFLVHGGRTWDTLNDVTSLLGSENVDGLEAVSTPEPTAGLLATIAMLGLSAFRRKRRQR